MQLIVSGAQESKLALCTAISLRLVMLTQLQSKICLLLFELNQLLSQFLLWFSYFLGWRVKLRDTQDHGKFLIQHFVSVCFVQLLYHLIKSRKSLCNFDGNFNKIKPCETFLTIKQRNSQVTDLFSFPEFKIPVLVEQCCL